MPSTKYKRYTRLDDFKERLDLEIGLHEEKMPNTIDSNGIPIPAEILGNGWTRDYLEGFIDGLKRAEELTDNRN